MIAGVDGCKAGWLVAIADQWPVETLVQLIICDTFSSVVMVTKDCQMTVVDMPIGLPECNNESSFPRVCDLEAKQLLALQASSVFFAPPRKSLSAATPTQFQEIHRELTGRGAGLPVWGIVPKIKEVDEAMNPALQKRIFEFHPELAWRRANNNLPLEKKKSIKGQQQRRSILEVAIQELPRHETWTAKVGRGAAIDDLFDALIGLKVASEFDKSHLLPQQPHIDGKGLKMQYVF